MVKSIISIVSIIFFFLSISGYILYIYKKTKIRLEFIPIIIFSSIICIIYLTGLLNIMQYMAYAIFLFGLGLFVFFLIKKQLPTIFNKSNLTIGSIFILLAFCYFAILLWDAKLISYDNFSHWGLVVKHMLVFNSMPNPTSIISYPRYPLGSSLFIYYVCRIIGATEGKMMIAQNILMLACIFPLFGTIKNKKSYYIAIITACASIYMIIEKIGLDNLLVDTLLPLVGLAATVIIFYYRNDVRKASILTLPIMITTLLIKESGIFFVIINCLFLLYIAFKANKIAINKREKAINFAYVFGIIFLTFFMLFLWKQHVDYVFQEVVSKNTMGTENFSSVFGSKTSQDIISNFLKNLFNIKNTFTKTVLFYNVSALSALALIIIIKPAYKKNMHGIINAIICADVLFLLYQAGLLGIYLFSFGEAEAIRLAAYDRYSASIIIYNIGILVIGFIHDYERFFDVPTLEISDKRASRIYIIKKAIVSTMMLMSIIAIGSTSISNNYGRLYHISNISNFKNTPPEMIEQLVGDNWSGYSNKKYLIYFYDKWGKQSSNYIYHIAYYKIFSSKITVISTIKPESFLKTLSEYDYLIVLKENETLSGFMNKYIERPKYFGIYPIHETFFKNN